MKPEEKLVKLTELAKEATLVRQATVDQLGQSIIELANVIAGVIGAGGKLLVAGNGGSATMSSHFAGEMVVRLTSERNRQALPAISLAADIGVITAAGNDYGFENIFARQIEALGQRMDMLLVMSTSGNSENLIRAARAAGEKQMITAALLGGKGGKLAKIIDRSLIIGHTSTQRIQEEHLFMVHTLVELVESDLFA